MSCCILLRYIQWMPCATVRHLKHAISPCWWFRGTRTQPRNPGLESIQSTGTSRLDIFVLQISPTSNGLTGPQPSNRVDRWPVQWQWEWFRQSLWKAFSSRERQLETIRFPWVFLGDGFFCSLPKTDMSLCIIDLFALWTSHLEGFCGCSKRLFCWVLVLGLWIWRFNAALLSSRRAGAAPGPASYAGMLSWHWQQWFRKMDLTPKKEMLRFWWNQTGLFT